MKLVTEFFRTGIVNCVSEAYEMLRFSSDHLITNAGTNSFDYVIVCWNPSRAVEDYIANLEKKLEASETRVVRVDHQSIDHIGYVPNLRAMINDGYEKAFELDDYAGLVNTDQAFYKNWLLNLVKHSKPNRMVGSTLIEAGSTRHYRFDLGTTEYSRFDTTTFNKLCGLLSKPGELMIDEDLEGLWGDTGYKNMVSLPHVFHRSMWEKVGPWELTLANGTPDVNFFDRAHAAGFEFVVSADSLAYHMGGAERGATGKSVPDFAKDLPYDPTPATQVKRGISHIVKKGLSHARKFQGLVRNLNGPRPADRNRLISELLKGYRTLIDIGCGGSSSATLHNLLMPLGFEKITGVDIHAPNIEERNQQFPNDKGLQFLCEDVSKDKVDQKYEAATLLNVLERMNRKSAIRSIDNIKESASRIIVETPNYFEHDLTTVANENNPYQTQRCLITREFMAAQHFSEVGSWQERPSHTRSIYVWRRATR